MSKPNLTAKLHAAVDDFCDDVEGVGYDDYGFSDCEPSIRPDLHEQVEKVSERGMDWEDFEESKFFNEIDGKL